MSPPPFDDWDREKILARRALFITTTVAALGCSSQGGQSTPTSATTETSVPAGTTTTAAPTGTANAPTKPVKLRAWAEVEKTLPPLSVGASVSGPEKEELGSLKERLAPHYAAIGKVWASPPKCAPKDCPDEWAAAAKAILDARDAVEGPGPCGEWGGIGLRQRRAEQTQAIMTLTKELEDALADAALAHGDATSWAKLVVLPPPPLACLKCAPPMQPGLLEGGHWGAPLSVLFADGSSTIEKDADEALAKIPKDAKDPIIVRGHADPTEPDPKKLAQARADAVRDRLVKKGIKANILTTTSFAGDLPIASSATDEGKRKNRRVDFAFKEPHR
ncbi:MAG: OmpA family protein [Polyangiaceae bacterium]|nr:OmpA family protein [Polyangiaceae bacterium]